MDVFLKADREIVLAKCIYRVITKILPALEVDAQPKQRTGSQNVAAPCALPYRPGQGCHFHEVGVLLGLSVQVAGNLLGYIRK